MPNFAGSHNAELRSKKGFRPSTPRLPEEELQSLAKTPTSDAKILPCQDVEILASLAYSSEAKLSGVASDVGDIMSILRSMSSDIRANLNVSKAYPDLHTSASSVQGGEQQISVGAYDMSPKMSFDVHESSIDVGDMSPTMTPKILVGATGMSPKRSPKMSVDARESSISANESSADVHDLLDILRGISLELQTNLKFTKAIYRGTKKSLTGPGNDVKRLHSLSFGDVPTHSDADPYSHRSRNSEADRQRMMDRQRSMDRRLEVLRGLGAQRDSQDQQRESARFSQRSTHVTKSASSKAASASAIQRFGESERTSHSPVSPEAVGSPLSCKLESQTSAHGLHESHTRMSRGNLQTTSTISELMSHHRTLQRKWTVRMWRFMEDPNSGICARGYFHLRLWFLAFSVIVSCLQAFDDSFESATNKGYLYIEVCIEGVFAIELISRFCVCSDRLLFAFDGFNLQDFLSVCPCALRIYVLASSSESTLEINTLFGMVPVLRLLKLLRHFDMFQLLWSAFISAAEALPIVIFTLFLIAITLASVIYYCEPRSSIPSMPLALYFAIVTVTTVGYGDFTPTSGIGRLWTCLLSVIGPMYMAIPIGIIGNAFSQVWEDRQRLLMLHKMRTYVKNVGYTEKELQNMFVLIDRNSDGTLDMEEFIAWLDVLDIKMPEHVICQVFESFDEDDEGSIDFNELLHGLYPRARYGWRKLRASLLD